MQKFLFLLVVFISTQVYGQLDLEHWFPPIYKSGGSIDGARLSLSTDKTTPFNVYIYNGSTLLDNVAISKSSPLEYNLDTKLSSVLISYDGDAMKVLQRGLHVVGENSFYANLKFYGASTEVISSKGKSALGKSFLVVNDQNILYGKSPGGKNYQVSIMAKEDNTVINFKNSQTLKFINGETTNSKTITLNNNESYSLVALKADNNPSSILDDNDPNIIGATITSNKPIVINNGNFLSLDAGGVEGSFNIDQSIPIEKLGKEYLLVNGMTDGSDITEKALIVATEDNTQIYFNSDTSPLITLNKGQHYIGPYGLSKKFVPGSEVSFTNIDGITVPTMAMYLKSTKPIYCYQLIGGFKDRQRPKEPIHSEDSGAMLLSFPMDQSYNRTEIVLSAVDNLGPLSLQSKINIKSKWGTNIKVNGVSLGQGSQVPGASAWKYNTIVNNTGNIVITADQSIIADFNAGTLHYDPVLGARFTGYAASLSSHSNDPYVIVNGNCIQEEITLKLSNEDFDSFQWQLNGADIPGANSSTLTPTAPGNYRCKIGYYGGIFYYTDQLIVSDCPYTVTEKDYGAICNNLTINPIFSAPNDQYTVDVIKILTQGTKGIAKIENGKITYTANPQSFGSDRFIYQICNTATGFCETIKANLTINPSPTGDNIVESIMPISFDDDSNTYNLTDAISPSKLGETYLFFEDINLSNAIITPTQYKTSSKTAYILITNTLGCTIVKSINLLDPKPQIVNLPNAFSPNDDGINDTWDFSLLKNTISPTVVIFDRYATKVFEFKNDDKFYWTGKDSSGRPLPTSSYWAVIQWTDKKTNLPMEKKMWILLKNR